MTGRERDREPKVASGEEDSFLGRWSKRKAGARAVETAAAERRVVDSKADPTIEEAARDGTVPVAAETDRSEPEDPAPFDVASLPDIDSLGPTSDFSVFMQAGVPSELKTKALRRLWRVKSELANLDGLIDYGEDLTGSFKVVDHLKTAYEVGRGFLKDDRAGEDQAAEAASTAGDEKDQVAAIDEKPSDSGEAEAQTGDDVDRAETGNTEERET